MNELYAEVDKHISCEATTKINHISFNNAFVGGYAAEFCEQFRCQRRSNFTFPATLVLH